MELSNSFIINSRKLFLGFKIKSRQKKEICYNKLNMKNLIERLIKKCGLGGICESTHWILDVEKKQIFAKSKMVEDKVYTNIILKKFDVLQSCVLSIPFLSKVKSMLVPLNEDINFSINSVEDKILGFSLSDVDCEVICTVSEFDSFPETPNILTTLEKHGDMLKFEVELNITNEFSKKLIKSANAMSESKDFVLMNNKKGGVDIILNYQNINTSRICLTADVKNETEKISQICMFHMPSMKEILSANLEIESNAVLKFSQSGIIHLTFEDDTFSSHYLLFGTGNL
jgi:hypothetical protein